jgi:hypothetical protein
MNKNYLVRLTDEERAVCDATVKSEKGKSEKLRRAAILLKADGDGPGWKDEKISEAVGCRIRTVENVRREFVLEGFEAALVRKKRTTPPTPKLLDGAAEAKLIAMRLGKPPAEGKGVRNRFLKERARLARLGAWEDRNGQPLVDWCTTF